MVQIPNGENPSGVSGPGLVVDKVAQFGDPVESGAVEAAINRARESAMVERRARPREVPAVDPISVLDWDGAAHPLGS